MTIFDPAHADLMDITIIRNKIKTYGIRLLHIFSLVFYGLNMVFAITLLVFHRWIGRHETGFDIPVLKTGQEFLVENILGVIVLTLIIAGIILLMRLKPGGAYLFYTGNVLFISYFFLRPEPDWYTSGIVLAICLLYLIPVRLIGTHSKLRRENLRQKDITP